MYFLNSYSISIVILEKWIFYCLSNFFGSLKGSDFGSFSKLSADWELEAENSIDHFEDFKIIFIWKNNLKKLKFPSIMIKNLHYKGNISDIHRNHYSTDMCNKHHRKGKPCGIPQGCLCAKPTLFCMTLYKEAW